MTPGKPVAVVVAVDSQRGIGKDGRIPWRIPADIRHFKRLTRETERADARNAVIMGRRTWESIPDTYRPLSGRKNVVLSRNPHLVLPEGVWLAGDLDAAIERVSRAPDIERVFIIGGGQVYAQALAMPACHDVYITRIHGSFECDTRFPVLPDGYELAQQLSRGEHDGVPYRIERWHR